MAVATATPPAHAASQQAHPVTPQVPFVAAAHEHIEPAFQFQVQPGANGVEWGPFDVPAYGYLRHIIIEVEIGVAGVVGPGTLAADFPFNLFERVSLTDVNGSPISELDGFALFVANYLGGYVFEQDPRKIDYDGTFAGAKFQLRIPVEINHSDGLGSVSNQNAAASYKVNIRTRPSAQLFPVAPTTAPTFAVRGYLEAWSQPNEVDLAGRSQEQVPPLHGTSQYWSSYVQQVVAGQNTTQLRRVGNMIRNFAFIARDATGARINTVFPDPCTLSWDGNTQFQESRVGHLRRLREKINDPVDLPVGVFAYPFAHSELNRSGDGPPALWLATLQSSRIELSGVSAVAGTLQVITNDIAPVEINPADRYEFPSRSGYAPRG